MKVVVCDDSMEDLEKIKELLIKYRETNFCRFEPSDTGKNTQRYLYS